MQTWTGNISLLGIQKKKKKKKVFLHSRIFSNIVMAEMHVGSLSCNFGIMSHLTPLTDTNEHQIRDRTEFYHYILLHIFGGGHSANCTKL